MAKTDKQRKEQLQSLINDPNSSDDIRELAKKQLASFEESKKVVVDASFSELMSEINTLIGEMADTGNGANRDETVKIVNDRLKSFKVGIDNLSAPVRQLLAKSQSYQMISISGQVVDMGGEASQRPLFQILLSDAFANNNSYLYGGAGTGKTFISKKIAKSLNYDLITVNCNQFTSPTELIGGQTIQGYQEGKVTKAFGNLSLPEGKDGCLLLLDELPKLDPNTAGVLNDALSKIKDPAEVDKAPDGTITVTPPSIENGRGQKIPIKKVYVIATGNSRLNEANKDYEANFKQDLSLQDRFAGSTYELFIDYKFELNNIMKNFVLEKTNMKGVPTDVFGKQMSFVFIFNFLVQLRNTIEDLDYTNRAFVSTRLMVSFRDTYLTQRLSEMSSEGLSRPKTLVDATESFLSLFTEQQQKNIQEKVDVNDFYKQVNAKNSRPLTELDTEEDNELAELLIDNYNDKRKKNNY